MIANPSARHCQECRTRLAWDNHSNICAACQRKVWDIRFRPPEVPAWFWETPKMREALAARHMGKVVHAFRTHPYHGKRPIPQALVGSWLNVDQTYISRKEKGPAPRDLEWLSRTARILNIPEKLLWFAPQEDADSSQTPETPSDIDAEPTEPTIESWLQRALETLQGQSRNSAGGRLASRVHSDRTAPESPFIASGSRSPCPYC